MQAIQIKYLGATNTKCARAKAVAGAGSITESRKYELNFDEQARELAERYIAEKGWNCCEISGFGCLPNGDYVATIRSTVNPSA